MCRALRWLASAWRRVVMAGRSLDEVRWECAALVAGPFDPKSSKGRTRAFCHSSNFSLLLRILADPDSEFRNLFGVVARR
jgi:hypothetical protein